ncbi:MAG: rhodanese-like domain-containing protein [Spirochaetales bacterium]|mgnify:FL=1|nr:rhodanese-like domain-containing protein [Spirochaetales bacterium]MBQ2259495.1 rhodanese-like domain-containing protein [Spirochaetales bacterium]
MGFFNLLAKDINKGYKEYLERENALLIDVRNEDEYNAGHIPGSKNIPLLKISKLSALADRSTPIYTYCLSGTRSSHAQVELCKMGFHEVYNIGGFGSYKGSVER